MLRLNRYIIALVLWLSFLFNIERIELHLGTSEISNLATPVYIIATLMVVLGIALPQWKIVPLWRLQVVAAVSFVIGLLLSGRSPWDGINMYVMLFEFTAVLVSVTLAYMVGRLSADFIETVRAMIYADVDGRVFTPEQAETVIKREMQASRRGSRPLSVMLLDTAPGTARLNMQATAREIQQILVKRQSLVALTRLLPRTLRRTDFVLHEMGDGRLVVVMPDVRREQTPAIIARLSGLAQRRLGLAVRYGIASFPENGVTFEELVYQAAQDLQPEQDDRRGEGAVERRESATEKLAVVGTEKLPVIGTEKLPVVEAGALHVHAE